MHEKNFLIFNVYVVPISNFYVFCSQPLEDKQKSESKSTFLFLVQTSKPLNSFGQSSVDRNNLIEIRIQNFQQNYSTVLSTFYFTANAFRIIFQIKKNRGGKVWRGGQKEVFCYACPHPHPIFLLIKMCYFIIVNCL